MTVNLGVTRIIDTNAAQAASGLPTIPDLTTYERLVSRIPALMLWVDPGNAPAGATPLLRDRRAGYKADKRAVDATTVITQNLVNGFPGIVYTGDGNQGIDITSFQVPFDEYTVVSVIRNDSAAAGCIVGGIAEPNARFNFTLNTNGALRLDHGVGLGSDVTAIGAVPTDGSSWDVVWGSYSQSDGSAAVGVNSVSASATADFVATHVNPVGIRLGRLANRNSFTGAQGETFFLNRASHVSGDTVGSNNLLVLVSLLTERYAIA